MLSLHQTFFLKTIVVLLLLFGGAWTRTETRNIEIVTQQNAIEYPPDLSHRIISHNITDVYQFPTLEAADDFVLPLPTWFQSLGVSKALDDCSSMTFSMGTIRTRSDANPTAITLVIYHHDPLTRRPSENQTLFKKTYYWPSNNYQWASDTLSYPSVTQFTIQYNELGDDGRTRFNFRDPSFLPSATTFWVSFYVTVSRHQSNVGFRMNSMYWRTLNNHTNSTPKEIFLHAGQENHDFVFRDRLNFLGRGYTNWTTAEIIERAMEIVPTTNNLDLTVSFSCLVSNLPLFEPTPSPTTIPTPVPSPPLPPSSSEITPSLPPPPPPPPTEEGNPVSNETHTVWEKSPQTVIMITVPLVFLLGCCTTLVVLVGMKKCEERKRKNSLLESSEMELPSTNMRALVARNGKVEHDDIFQSYELPLGGEDKLSRNPLIMHTKSQESGDFIEIPLDHSPRLRGGGGKMRKSVGGSLFNNRINTGSVDPYEDL